MSLQLRFRDHEVIAMEHDPPRSVSTWFAAEVRRYREKAGWSQAELANRLFCSEQKVGHLETGYRTPADIDICVALDKVFGLDRHFEGMYPLIKREQLPDMLWRFIEAESEAGDIKVYETQVIPGLLQTESYAREVFKAGFAQRSVDERVATRLDRQRILSRKNPPRLWVVIDEPALRRAVGGAEVMNEQYAHLLAMVDQDHVKIQVIPGQTAAHAGLQGSFHLFTLQDGSNVAWSEAPGVGWFFDQPDAVAKLAVQYDLIRTSALPVEASLDLIGRLLEEL
jgi:transcriptional regulator with XRE-family HTH domain